MKVFNFLNCDAMTLQAIIKLQEILPFVIAKGGTEVELQRCEQGYRITKTKHKITVEYSKKPMLFRSILTLVANNEEVYVVEEECAFTDFGIMIDMSRNAVVNKITIKEFVLHIASLGYHSLLLYTEDTYEVQKEEYFGYMRGALTSEEIKELDAYCEMFGIELIPCIQCLAHLNQITRYQDYDCMIDVNDILLVGDERTEQFLEHAFSTLAENFKSRKINIGMDEAHMLGLGKYLDQHGYENRTSLMLKHLELIRKLCKKHGFTPSMWSDMFLNTTEGFAEGIVHANKGEYLLDEIPKDICLIYWDYNLRDYSIYKENIDRHLKITDNMGFAGGAWKWTGFAPDNEYSIGAGKNSIKACKESGVKNFLLTCWGDNGAEASLYSILPSIYFYAESAYREEVEYSKFELLTGITFEDYMSVDLPNRLLDKEFTRNNASKYFLYNDLFIGTFDSLVTKDMADTYQQHARTLRKICKKDSRYSYMFDVLQRLCSILSMKVDLGVRIKANYDSGNREALHKITAKEIPKLLRELRGFYKTLQAQWMKENKAFGFEVQCIRFGGLLARIEYTKDKLNAYLKDEIASIEELEVDRKPFSYFNNETIDQLIYNLWNVIVSPSAI